MDALISGTTGRALLVDAGHLKSFDVDEPSKLVPRTRADFAYLFGEMQDLRVIENTDIESVRRELKLDSDSALALDLALISLDPELPDDIRREAIEGLDELLSDARVAERLENLLYARPLPEDADLTSTLRLCNDRDGSGGSNFLRRLEELEPFISEVSEAWDSIPTKVFGDYDERAEFLHAAVREGLFRTLVIIRETQSTTWTFLLNAGLNSSVKQLPNHRQVLQHWTTSFRQSAPALTVKHEIEELVVTEASPRRRHGRRVGIDRKAVLREVNKRKGIIIGAMLRRDAQQIHELVDDLVNFHRIRSEPEHTAKSLCDLAMEAKALGMSLLQLELTERSINIAPSDSWSWAQYGDALLNMQQLDKALSAYEQADFFAAGVVAKTGRAEVLKAQGLLDDALTAYDEVIELHPEDVVAKTGRAEVLKAKGLLDDALAAYDEVFLRFPNEEIARNGRACILAAFGRFDEALEFLPDKTVVSLQDWIGQHIRGMILLKMRKRNEAIGLLNEGLQDCPWPVQKEYFRAALVVAWLRGGDFTKAKQHLDDVKAPQLQAAANVLRLHVFGAEGNLQSANKVFQSIAATPLHLNQLTQELQRRFLLHEQPHHDDEWISDQEVDLFLLAA